jgi:hypothetical protein
VVLSWIVGLMAVYSIRWIFDELVQVELVISHLLLRP